MKTITATLSINVVIECPNRTTPDDVRAALSRMADQAAGSGLFTIGIEGAEVSAWGSDVTID
jgi:hypothetical protein